MAKVLLDSASHHIFKTDQLAKRLKLTPEQKELVSTFAAKTPQQVNTSVVRFNLITKDHANGMNKITGPIQRGPIQPSDLESITPEKIFDTIPKAVNFDLLIRSDCFWTNFSVEKVTLPSGFLQGLDISLQESTS